MKRSRPNAERAAERVHLISGGRAKSPDSGLESYNLSNSDAEAVSFLVRPSAAGDLADAGGLASLLQFRRIRTGRRSPDLRLLGGLDADFPAHRHPRLHAVSHWRQAVPGAPGQP